MMIRDCARVLVLWVVSALFALGCGNSKPLHEGEAIGKTTAAVTIIRQNDFEDGTLQGWIPRGPVTLTNTTEAAADGTHSLKTTGRTAGFHGPSLNALPIIARGATYQISVSVRLVSGEAPTQIRMTMQQTPAGGSNQFIPVASNSSVTDAAFVTLTGNFSYNIDVSGLLLYVEASSATASYYIDGFTITELTPPPALNIFHGFEDGTLQGWIPRGPVTLTNTADAAADGARSLLTTGRTAGFNGPSLNVLGVLRKGATYGVSVKARLVTGTAATTIKMTVQRTPVGAANAFDPIGSSVSVTDAAFVTMSGTYSFGTDVSGLLLYVEAAAATASYYIDSFSMVELAPPPGPPANTTGAVAAFETGQDGWFSRTGTETVAVSNADAHSGTQSLLTTNRTSSFRGPALDVTNVMFNGSRYRISLWVKLAPAQADTQLRLSLDRRLGTVSQTFHQVIGNTTVTSGAWVRMATTFDQILANTTLILYLETNSGAPLSSFYLDDVQIDFVPPPVAERDIPSVFQSLSAYFPVGAAVHAGDLSGEHAFLLTKHFNSVTSENDMKWSSLQPTEGSFTYGVADAQVAFAKQKGLRVRGHTLVWHQQTPAWVFNDASGVPLTPTPENKALLLARLESHIRAVVGHFGADLYAWDVVNEVIDPNQADGFRRSPWFDIIGPEFIDRAFQVAHEVAPNAELYINDFDTTNAVKRQFLHDLVADLKSRGVPVHGVGHQMHNNVDFPSSQAIVDTINMFDALGVKNEITELDVSIYSNSLPGPIADYFDIPAERLVAQGYRYRDFFDAFKRLQGKIGSVTFWGQADDHTWLASSGRTNAPLLFDQSLKKKKAYWGIIDPNQLPGADLVTSLDAGSTALAGQSIDFTIAVENRADEDEAAFLPADDDLPAQNVSLSGAIAAQTAFGSLAVPEGWSCTTPEVGGSGQLSCSLAELPAAASDAFTLSLTTSCATPDGTLIVQSASASSTTRDPSLAANNAASASVQVQNPPPVVTLNGEAAVTLECTTPFTDPGATAADSCDGAVNVSTSGVVDSGAVGSYTLLYTASDSAGGQASATRSVSVVDTLAPVMDAIDLTVLLPGIRVSVNGQILTVNGSMYSLSGGTLTILGHTFTLSGSSIVIDGRSFALDGQTILLLLPVHQYQTIRVAELIAALNPDCDPNLDLSDILITEVTSDELEDAPGGSDGTTLNDIAIGADCRSVGLRVERVATGNGRVYGIKLRVRDASGNTTERSLKVVVPRNVAIGTAIDDGARYTVAATCP
jgi:endo-1,4-beta-xylanase